MLLTDILTNIFFILQVLCSGEGLRQGVVGREIRSWIDTRRAGPGELTAHCTGPRKVAYCELYDHGDATFTLNVKPQEPGRHALTVKYAGQHVPGSPFVLKVAGAPDASKVSRKCTYFLCHIRIFVLDTCHDIYWIFIKLCVKI